MHVARNVEMSLAVECHRDVVVRVPEDLGGQFLIDPLSGIQRPSRDRHVSFGIVVCHVLAIGCGEQFEPDREFGSDFGDLECLCYDEVLSNGARGGHSGHEVGQEFHTYDYVRKS